MMTFFIINQKKFEEIMNVEKFAMTTGQRKKMKERIVDRLKDTLDLRWDRMKKVLIVIDEIIYKLTDRGFSFNGRKTLAKKCKVSLRTVDKAIRYLKDSNLFFVGYRENTSSNGVKTPIFFYKQHQLFNKYSLLLNLQKCNEDCKVKDAETPCGSKTEPIKRNTTFFIPSSFNNYINKRTEDVLDKSFVSEAVPKEFSNLVSAFFDNHKIIEEYWKMVRISNYYTKYTNEVMVPLALQSFKQMMGKLKQGKVKKNPFAYFYGVVQKKLDELYFEELHELSLSDLPY